MELIDLQAGCDAPEENSNGLLSSFNEALLSGGNNEAPSLSTVRESDNQNNQQQETRSAIPAPPRPPTTS
jgi:hypothetical protein